MGMHVAECLLHRRSLAGLTVRAIEVAGDRVARVHVFGDGPATAAVLVEVDRVHDLEVIDVHADGEHLAVWLRRREHAWVGVVKALESLLLEPVEEHALKPPTSLLNTIDRLLDSRVLGRTRVIVFLVSRRQLAEYDLPIYKAALEVSCYQVDAAHLAAVASSIGEERARR